MLVLTNRSDQTTQQWLQHEVKIINHECFIFHERDNLSLESHIFTFITEINVSRRYYSTVG